MNRIALFLLGFLGLFTSHALAVGEIGYVEDFHGAASGYRVIREGQEIALKLCLPLQNGDRIEVAGDDGRVVLRLIGRPDPVVWSKADGQTPIAAELTRAGFWSNFLDWTVASISPLDEEKRAQVLTNIRNDGNQEFAVPLFKAPQTIAAGKRTIAFGWLKPSQVVEVSILLKSGKKIISKAKGSGGLWVSPELDLKAGNYRVEVAAGGTKAEGKIMAVDPSKLPAIPEELRIETIPEPMRRTAQALWLAAQGKGEYRMEALMMLASAKRSPSEKLLLEALIAGKPFNLPE